MFLADYPEMDPCPTLRDLVAQEADDAPFLNRTTAEDMVWAALPGDDLSGHLLGAPNPYTGKPYSELKALLNTGGLPRDEWHQVESALKECDLHHLHPHTSRVR